MDRTMNRTYTGDREHCNLSLNVYQREQAGPVFMRVGKKYKGEGAKEQVSHAWFEKAEFIAMLKEIISDLED